MTRIRSTGSPGIAIELIYYPLGFLYTLLGVLSHHRKVRVFTSSFRPADKAFSFYKSTSPPYLLEKDIYNAGSETITLKRLLEGETKPNIYLHFTSQRVVRQ
jgi:hypothetical protein